MTEKVQDLPSCATCDNSYLAIRTDVYKDKREFVYCDCCGAMADKATWMKMGDYSEALSYAQDLAKSMAKTHYSHVQGFDVFDNLANVMTQIDNMVTGLERSQDHVWIVANDVSMIIFQNEESAKAIAGHSATNGLSVTKTPLFK